ncbi:MAG: hypothetical protein OXF88_09435 [Rhodobacteraceae bacterium]|nr:hypothetical protein [Paracoccaceae bacterium]MCY4141400.1 hypothetical protein [Paracoccaceae bacterium]
MARYLVTIGGNSETFLPHDIAIVRLVVEAANEIIAAQRSMGSGVRWSKEGRQAIMTFHAPILSGRFDRVKHSGRTMPNQPGRSRGM